MIFSMAYATSILEIFLIWFTLNYLLKFFWKTRTLDVVFGLSTFLCLFFLTKKLNLPVIHYLMLHVINVAVIVVFIIFQPEIRLALSKIRFYDKRLIIDSQSSFIEHLTTCIYHMAEQQIGALIVIENTDSFDEFINFSSVRINADFSEDLLITIFNPASPLHDGAVIIKEETIAFARVILPLAPDTKQLSRTMGTRHRAALGASQRTDALIITVSEESGHVALSRDGIITRDVKMDRFKAVLRSSFSVRKDSPKSLSFRSWFQ